MASKISLTVNGQRNRADKLLHIEKELLRLMETKLNITACDQMVDLLLELMKMRPTRLEWQQHAALSTAMCRTLLSMGKDIPETMVNGRLPKLVVALKKLRKTARDTKRQCMELFNCTMETHKDFERALFQYKNVMKSFNVYLFSLADHQTCREIALKHHRMVAKQSDAAAYAQQWTLGEFIMFTNIRPLVYDEIIKLCADVQKKAELNKEDDYIARIHKEFLQIPEAWQWTLLVDIKCTDAFFGSDWLLRYNGITQNCTVALRKENLQILGSEKYYQLSRELAASTANYYTQRLFNQVKLVPEYMKKHLRVYDLDGLRFEGKQNVATQTSNVLPNTTEAMPIANGASAALPPSSCQKKASNPPESNAIAQAYSHSGDGEIVAAEKTTIDTLVMFGADEPNVAHVMDVEVSQKDTPFQSANCATSDRSTNPAGDLAFDTAREPSDCESDIFLTDAPVCDTDLTTPCVVATTQISEDSPITCFQKPLQSISHNTVAVANLSPIHDDYGGDVEILDEQPSQGFVVIEDFDSTQALIKCLQTPGIIVQPPTIPMVTQSDELSIPMQTQCVTVLSSQEVDTSSMSSEQKSSDVEIKTICQKPPQEITVVQPMSPTVVQELSGVMNKQPSKAVVLIGKDDTTHAHTEYIQTHNLIVKPSIPIDTPSAKPATPIQAVLEVDTSSMSFNDISSDVPLQNLPSVQHKLLQTPAGSPVPVSLKQQPIQRVVAPLRSPIAMERPSQVATSKVKQKRCVAEQSQLDRTQVPRHKFEPLTFCQSTKPAIVGAAISALVPNENDPIETDSSSDANGWHYETQPMIFGMNENQTKRRENEQLEPAVQVNGHVQVQQSIQTVQQQPQPIVQPLLQTEQQPTVHVSVQPSMQTVQQQPTEQVSVAEQQQSGCAENENKVWNAVADPNSLAAIIRQILKSGRFELHNRSTELNFEINLVSAEPEILLNAEMFYLLMNVTPAERPLLFDIVNATSPNIKYGDENRTNELMCLLLKAADPANGFNLQDRCKNVRDIHNCLTNLKRIRDNMVARM